MKGGLVEEAADPPLASFLAKQPEVELPGLLDEVKSLKDLQEEPRMPGLFQVIRETVGKDFSQPIPMPVEISEPTSDMMKRAEEIEHSQLLDKAAELPQGSLERLIQVAAFAYSAYATGHADRIGKPLFVIPGETLEVVLPQKGLRFIAEAVQDNGWVIVAHAEGRGWKLSSDDQLKLKFGANSLEFIPRWFTEIRFEDGDLYTWQKLTCVANQTLTQPVFLSHHGKLMVKQVDWDRTAVLQFKAIPMTALTTKAKKAANRPVEGYVTENGKRLLGLEMRGLWDSHLDLTQTLKASEDSFERLWTRTPLPEGVNRFQLPAFTAGMCKLPAELRSALPSTDSRNRKDRDLIEIGSWKEAGEEKARLEAIGLATAITAKQSKGLLQPRWFEADPDREHIAAGEGIRWRYSHRYWAAKEQHFSEENLPNLFA